MSNVCACVCLCAHEKMLLTSLDVCMLSSSVYAMNILKRGYQSCYMQAISGHYLCKDACIMIVEQTSVALTCECVCGILATECCPWLLIYTTNNICVQERGGRN